MTDWKSIKKIANLYADAVITDCIGNFSYRKAYRSFFREDKHPTCQFFKTKEGVLLFHDFATGEKHDLFYFLKYFKNLNFNESIQYIADSFNCKQQFEEVGYVFSKSEKMAKKENIKPLQVKQRKVEIKKEADKKFTYDYEICYWSKRHLDFWLKYKVSNDIQLNASIRPIRSLIRNVTENDVEKSSKKLWEWNDLNNPNIGFVFYEDATKPEGNKQFYFPYADKKYKFVNDGHCIFKNESIYSFYANWKLDTLGQKRATADLFITKSAKDFMVWDYFGLPCWGTTGETTNINWWQVIHDYLKNNLCPLYLNIYILADNDEPGIEAANSKIKAVEEVAPFILTTFGVEIKAKAVYATNAKDMTDEIALPQHNYIYELDRYFAKLAILQMMCLES